VELAEEMKGGGHGAAEERRTPRPSIERHGLAQGSGHPLKVLIYRWRSGDADGSAGKAALMSVVARYILFTGAGRLAVFFYT
jgi:hypothetical protein